MLVTLPVASDDVVTLALEALRQVRGNKATAASDADLQLSIGPVRLKGVLGKLAALIVILVDRSGRHDVYICECVET